MIEILDYIETDSSLELNVRDRGHNRRIDHTGMIPRFYAMFNNAEEKVFGCCLQGTYGNGDTPDEAIRDYCAQISNKDIVLFSFTSQRKEITLPKLKHTNKYNGTIHQPLNI